jgi:phenylpropionate dioxygenase-like ring-hydroxylating dioxygenase large terminal subunit
MTEAKPFPSNAWYAAAWGHEIKHELAARTICDKDVVLYRRSDGQVAALEDACWHRLLPLSLGRLHDDQVVCGYHGLVFNCGTVHLHAGAENHQSLRLRPCVPGGRATSAGLVVAGRSGAG